jgi:hypothetical protein
MKVINKETGVTITEWISLVSSYCCNNNVDTRHQLIARYHVFLPTARCSVSLGHIFDRRSQ